jgi:hypothetical protein
LTRGEGKHCHRGPFYQRNSPEDQISFGGSGNSPVITFYSAQREWCEAQNQDPGAAKADIEVEVSEPFPDNRDFNFNWQDTDQGYPAKRMSLVVPDPCYGRRDLQNSQENEETLTVRDDRDDNAHVIVTGLSAGDWDVFVDWTETTGEWLRNVATVYKMDTLTVEDGPHASPPTASDNGQHQNNEMVIFVGPDEQATISFSLTWSPDLPDIGYKFKWKLESAGPPPGWDNVEGDFQEGPFTSTWTRPNPDPGVRICYLIAWCDHDMDGEKDDGECYRQVKITLVTFESLTVKDQALPLRSRTDDSALNADPVLTVVDRQGGARILVSGTCLPPSYLADCRFRINGAGGLPAEGSLGAERTVILDRPSGNIPNPIEVVAGLDLNRNGFLDLGEETRRVIVYVVVVDLDILKPNGDEVPEEEEDSKGEVVPVNVDDDDNDGGLGGHGQVVVVPDTDDTDGVANENDLVVVKIRALPIEATHAGEPLFFRLEWASMRIAVWRFDTKLVPVLSGIDTFDILEEHTLYVEGLNQSAPGQGELLTLKLYEDAQLLGSDAVKAMVAEMIFSFTGPGATGDLALLAYLSQVRKDERADPYIVLGADRAFAIHIWNTEKKFKLALSTPDSSVAYDGHSNFGIGLTFSLGCARLRDFVNVGDGLVGIDWPYLRDNGHPNLDIPDAEYGDDPTTGEQYDPWKYERVIQGQQPHTVQAFAASKPPGTSQLHLARGAEKYLDVHDQPLLVVCGGAADMPVRRWRRIYLFGCTTGRYYYNVFNHGTLFFTNALASSGFTTRAFVEAIVGGKTDQQILNALNEQENIHDYRGF